MTGALPSLDPPFDLFWNDVFHLKGQAIEVLRDATILANATRSLPDQIVQRSIHELNCGMLV